MTQKYSIFHPRRRVMHESTIMVWKGFKRWRWLSIASAVHHQHFTRQQHCDKTSAIHQQCGHWSTHLWTLIRGHFVMIRAAPFRGRLSPLRPWNKKTRSPGSFLPLPLPFPSPHHSPSSLSLPFPRGRNHLFASPFPSFPSFTFSSLPYTPVSRRLGFLYN